VRTDDDDVKTKEMEAGPKASYGYGGKFGVQKDRMDKVWTQYCQYGCLNGTMKTVHAKIKILHE